jgi:hypothetical protein
MRGITLVSSVVFPDPLQPAKPMMRMEHHSLFPGRSAV